MYKLGNDVDPLIMCLYEPSTNDHLLEENDGQNLWEAVKQLQVYLGKNGSESWDIFQFLDQPQLHFQSP